MLIKFAFVFSGIHSDLRQDLALSAEEFGLNKPRRLCSHPNRITPITEYGV
jgi:hypothetical protein